MLPDFLQSDKYIDIAIISIASLLFQLFDYENMASFIIVYLLISLALEILNKDLKSENNFAPIFRTKYEKFAIIYSTSFILIPLGFALIFDIPNSLFKTTVILLVSAIFLMSRITTRFSDSIPIIRVKEDSTTIIKSPKSEEAKLLEMVGQGYFLCRRVESLDPARTFSVVFTNRKADDILKQADCNLETIFKMLHTLDDNSKNLHDATVEVFGNDVKIGSCVKFNLEIKKIRTSSKELITQDTLQSNKIMLEENAYKVVPFRYFKASLWKVSHTDVLLIINELDHTVIAHSANDLNTAIACTLTHDLRNITNGLIGNIQLCSDDPQLFKVHNNIALSSGYLLVDRLNDLFDYMQIKNKGFKAHYTEFHLEEILQHVTNVVQPLAKERQIKFMINKNGKVSNTIVGDKNRIQQILVDLALKTLEFTDYGNVILEITSKKDNMITFSVISEGGSMHAKLERILNEFSPSILKKRKEELLNQSEESTQNLEALSLQICQLICKELGTSITAQSESNSKTQLKFSIKDGFADAQNKRINFKRLLRKCETNMAEKQIIHIMPNNNDDRSPIDSNNSLVFSEEELPMKKNDSDVVLQKELQLSPPDFKTKSMSPACKSTFGQPIFNFQFSDVSRKVTEEIKENNENEKLTPNNLSTNKLSIDNLPKERMLIKKESAEIIEEIPEEATTEENLSLLIKVKKSYIPPMPTITEVYEKNLKQKDTVDLLPLPRISSPYQTKYRRTTTPSSWSRMPEYYNSYADANDSCKVLIVDDNTTNRFVLKSLLRKQGYACIEAQDGSEAVDLVARSMKSNQCLEIKLILMDLQMPVMNGIQATSSIRKMCKLYEIACPAIIGVSADPVEEDRLRFVRAGLDEFMNKPVDKDKIGYLIKKYLK